MVFLLIADSFFPLSNSAAILIEDLVHEFEKKRICTVLIIPNNSIFKKTTVLVQEKGVILRARSFNSKSHNALRRAFSEMINPFLIILAIQLNKIFYFDGIIWYSPSIFFGAVIRFLKFKKNVKSYLILRDIFPQWAFDVKVLNKSFVYYLFKFFESFQYNFADKIGIQSVSNLDYFKKNYPIHLNKIEVLENWMHQRDSVKTVINLSKSKLKGRFIFVYAGNFGKSQKIEQLLNLASLFEEHKTFGFLFIGSGSEYEKIKETIHNNSLSNVLMLDAIPSQELISVYKQCDIGLITLNLDHSTHNIPGKFISYLLSGLPVVAITNQGNDLIEIINKNNLGVAFSSQKMGFIKENVLKFIHSFNKDQVAVKCINFAKKNYSPQKAATQIINFFK